MLWKNLTEDRPLYIDGVMMNTTATTTTIPTIPTIPVNREIELIYLACSLSYDEKLVMVDMLKNMIKKESPPRPKLVIPTYTDDVVLDLKIPTPTIPRVPTPPPPPPTYECPICYDIGENHKQCPNNHTAACLQCYNKILDCPICRLPLRDEFTGGEYTTGASGSLEILNLDDIPADETADETANENTYTAEEIAEENAYWEARQWRVDLFNDNPYNVRLRLNIEYERNASIPNGRIVRELQFSRETPTQWVFKSGSLEIRKNKSFWKKMTRAWSGYTFNVNSIKLNNEWKEALGLNASGYRVGRCYITIAWPL